MGLQKANIPWSMENPTNSYFWDVPCVNRLRSAGSITEVRFQSCMFGSNLPKWTTFWLSPAGMFDRLRRVCDGLHTHGSWGRRPCGAFATAAEAVYPPQLREAMAAAVAT